MAACGMAILPSCKDNSLFMSQQAEDEFFFEYQVALKQEIEAGIRARRKDATVADGVDYSSTKDLSKSLKIRAERIDRKRAKSIEKSHKYDVVQASLKETLHQMEAFRVEHNLPRQ